MYEYYIYNRDEIYCAAFIIIILLGGAAAFIVAEKPKYRKIGFLLVGVCAIILITCILFPNKEYLTANYGDPLTARIDQKAVAEMRERQSQFFFECLDRGQKQPNRTTFNDTNEVVKTCYRASLSK